MALKMRLITAILKLTKTNIYGKLHYVDVNFSFDLLF